MKGEFFRTYSETNLSVILRLVGFSCLYVWSKLDYFHRILDLNVNYSYVKLTLILSGFLILHLAFKFKIKKYVKSYAVYFYYIIFIVTISSIIFPEFLNLFKPIVYIFEDILGIGGPVTNFINNSQKFDQGIVFAIFSINQIFYILLHLILSKKSHVISKA